MLLSFHSEVVKESLSVLEGYPSLLSYFLLSVSHPLSSSLLVEITDLLRL